MKICIVCFDFKETNIRLQPWRYIYEMSKTMKSMGVDVEIISDGYPTLPQKDDINGLPIHRLKQLRTLPFVQNSMLVRTIIEVSPDAIIWTVGITSLFLLSTFKKINKPIIGLWMNTIYSPKQIISLGLSEITRNFNSIYLHIFNTLMPSFFIKSVFRSPFLKRIIVLNKNTKNLLMKLGLPQNNIFVIPPGITEYDLDIPNIKKVKELRKEIGLEQNIFIVLYLGAPFSLRGVDTLIDATALIYKEMAPLKLLILSRRRLDILIDEENYIKDLCREHEIESKIKIISGFLGGEDIKKFISLSDVVALPFKLVQSDTPISILEAMALGKTVISTKIDGIPELLNDGRGCLINPNDPKDLANAIVTLYSNPQLKNDMGKKARIYMSKHPTWDQTTQYIITMINEVVYQNSDKVAHL